MKLAGLFVGLCGAGVPLWWAGLYQSVALRRLFVPTHAWSDFQAVLGPDLILAAGSAILSVQLVGGRPSRSLAAAVLGGWAYATVYSITWARAVGAPLIGPALMIAALTAVASVWYGLVSTRASRRA